MSSKYIISQLISRINQELTVCEEMLGYFPLLMYIDELFMSHHTFFGGNNNYMATFFNGVIILLILTLLKFKFIEAINLVQWECLEIIKTWIIQARGPLGFDHMIVGYTSTYTINDYQCLIPHYVIIFVSNLWQVIYFFSGYSCFLH